MDRLKPFHTVCINLKHHLKQVLGMRIGVDLEMSGLHASIYTIEIALSSYRVILKRQNS